MKGIHTMKIDSINIVDTKIEYVEIEKKPSEICN